MLESFFLSEVRGIFRPAQGCLARPYFVPGGIFHDELWDWDSFWITRGLLALSGLQTDSEAGESVVHAKGSWPRCSDAMPTRKPSTSGRKR